VTLTVADIAKEAFDGVAAELSGVIHAASVNGSPAGRVVQDDKRGPSGFAPDTSKDKALTVYCEGFQPSIGDTLAYNSTSHLVFWVHDIVAGGGLARAIVLPGAEWLSETVEFQAKTQTPNGTGGFTEEWTAIEGAATSAFVMAVSGNETFASDRVEARSGWRVICEYFAGLTEVHRVLIGGKAHNIRFVNDWEKRGVWLIVDVEAGVAT
jgi:head-tail adaptor